MMAIINNCGSNNSTKLTSTGNHNCSIASSSSSSNSSSSMEDENVICPLCMENLDIDDRSFYPCTCGYQICRFCWHRIRSESDDQNGLCPACRKQYSENPATFKPLSSEDIQKLKLQKRQKDQQKKQKSESGKRHLADLRVVQKNLVFVVGISPRIADPDVLKKNEFFGKFGKIHKVVVNPCLQGSTASAYITYIRSDDALRAIQSVNNIPFDGKTIKVSLGTTKYCSHFMRNQTCPKTECMYLHHYGDPDASFTKEDMQAGKHQDYEKKLLDEFNTHVNNNNNENSSGGGSESKANGVKEVVTGKVKHNGQRIANGSSIQQGVSYSTKLLVNNPPPQQPTPSTSPPSSQPPQQQKPQQQQNQPPPERTTPPISSSSSSTSSTSDQNIATATNLLESTILSDEENEDEDEYHEAISDVVQPPQTTVEQYDEFSNANTLDLDFDPFHETQKAFEEIINEQVGDGQEQASMLRRFIKPDDTIQRDYLLGFHNTAPPQQQSLHLPSPSTPPSHQPHNFQPQVPQTTQSSLLLDFFNSYAYKQTQQPVSSQTSIPPPPGFSTTQQQAPQPNQLSQSNGSSSGILDKLNRTLLGNDVRNHWGNEMEDQNRITNTAADWMSLDPAIIFSKGNSGERNNATRNFIDNPLHNIFGDSSRVGGIGMHHHLQDNRDRIYNAGQIGGQNGFNTQQQHQLISRPTPTSSSPSYPYTNGLLHQQQQQYYNTRPTQQYYQQQIPQQQRYYDARTSTQGSVVTPPPPGFGLHSTMHKQPTQQQYNNVYLQQQQQMHTGSSPNTSGFFPF